MKFLGEYNHTIDTKGRLIVPSKFRDLLAEEFIVTRGLGGCLFAFTRADFETFVENFNKGSDLDPKLRKLKRFFIAGAQEAEFDKQGRILVPAVLREHASLEKDVVFAGVGSYIEIWDKAKWDETCAFDDIDAIANELSALGIQF